MAEIVELDWSGTVDIDFSTGLGLPDGAVFNPATSLLRVGGGFSAQQFDVYGAGADMALVRVRGADGSEIAPAVTNYFYIPGMVPGQLAVFGDAGGRNLQFADGSHLVIGDGALGTAGDDLGNDINLASLGAAADFLFLRGGDDTARAGGGNDRVLLNQGNDLAYGGDGDDSIYGGQGNDSVYGEGGNDLLFGDLGDDYVSAGFGNNVLFGGAGKDRFAAQDGNDTIYGGGDDDYLEFSGVGGDKYLYGDRGSDEFALDGTFGMWRLYGGDGENQFDIRAHQGDLFIEAGTGGSLADIEDVLGKLELHGGADRDLWSIVPSTGFNHVLDAREGDDVLSVFGGGNLQSFEMVDLGDGNDRLDLSGYAGSDRQNWYLGTGSDTVMAGSGGIFHVEGGTDFIAVGSGRVEAVLGNLSSVDYALEFEGYRPGFDRVRVVDDIGLSGLVIHKGDGLSGTTAETNWLIATDASYSIDTFDSFLSATEADTAKPGFFTFLDGHVQTWFTYDMSSTAGAMKVVDYLDLTSLQQLDLFHIGGGDLDLIGGD
ncbi:hypothetical protein STAQ_10860 [Allostella sp. ATCC 35155]|nr:hypothetical protein STAQ_10860 [Stella sp. ATCC 35155]